MRVLLSLNGLYRSPWLSGASLSLCVLAFPSYSTTFKIPLCPPWDPPFALNSSPYVRIEQCLLTTATSPANKASTLISVVSDRHRPIRRYHFHSSPSVVLLSHGFRGDTAFRPQSFRVSRSLRFQIVPRSIICGDQLVASRFSRRPSPRHSGFHQSSRTVSPKDTTPQLL